MTEWHNKSKRKPTGGRLRTDRRSDKKLYSKGGTFSATKVSAKENDSYSVSAIGGNSKLKLREAKTASVLDPSSGKSQKMEIATVVENLSNREFARRNILTKGAIIEVKKGSETLKAKVTSRPGQSGVVNAILIK